MFWFSMIWNCLALKIGYQCRIYNFDQQNFKKVPLALSWHTTLLHITLLHLSTTDKQTDKYAWYYSLLIHINNDKITTTGIQQKTVDIFQPVQVLFNTVLFQNWENKQNLFWFLKMFWFE